MLSIIECAIIIDSRRKRRDRTCIDALHQPKLEVAAAEVRWGWAAESLFSRTWESSSLIRIGVISSTPIHPSSVAASNKTALWRWFRLHRLRPKHLS